MRAFSLDFGERSVEKEQAERVAEHLDIPLTFVQVGGEDVAPMLLDLVWKLDLPFGDAGDRAAVPARPGGARGGALGGLQRRGRRPALRRLDDASR